MLLTIMVCTVMNNVYRISFVCVSVKWRKQLSDAASWKYFYRCSSFFRRCYCGYIVDLYGSYFVLKNV